jgi:hypothetical protein
MMSPALSADQFKDCGCIYTAFGFEYLMLAAHSAATLKRHNPGLRATVITNVPVKHAIQDDVQLFDEIIYFDRSSALNRDARLSANLISRYHKTLMLDCDTEVRGDLSPIFSLLDNYDVAVRLLNRVTKASFEVFDGRLAHELNLSEWNAGVIFFRDTEKTRELFERWRDIFQREAMTRDQPAFMRAVLATRGLCLLPLSPLWNAKPGRLYESDLLETEPAHIRIFHYREPFAHPQVAKAIYRTYSTLGLQWADGVAAELVERCSDERKRFNVLYYYYALLLTPFDNAWGRRLLRVYWVKRLKTLLFIAWFRLRSSFLREAAIRPGRDRRVAGERFPKAAQTRPPS